MKNKTVLIVDDSKVVLNLHSHFLRSAGYRCLTAESGFEALEILTLETVDLILTDLNMPRMNGYELVKRVRAQAQFNALPIIMISTEEEESDRTKGLEAGANLYIVKPAQAETLIANISMLMPRKAS